MMRARNSQSAARATRMMGEEQNHRGKNNAEDETEAGRCVGLRGGAVLQCIVRHAVMMTCLLHAPAALGQSSGSRVCSLAHAAHFDV